MMPRHNYYYCLLQLLFISSVLTLSINYTDTNIETAREEQITITTRMADSTINDSSNVNFVVTTDKERLTSSGVDLQSTHQVLTTQESELITGSQINTTTRINSTYETHTRSTDTSVSPGCGSCVTLQHEDTVENITSSAQESEQTIEQNQVPQRKTTLSPNKTTEEVQSTSNILLSITSTESVHILKNKLKLNHTILQTVHGIKQKDEKNNNLFNLAVKKITNKTFVDDSTNYTIPIEYNINSSHVEESDYVSDDTYSYVTFNSFQYDDATTNHPCRFM